MTETAAVDIRTVRYIDVGDFRVRTAEIGSAHGDDYAGTVVARSGVEVDDAPVVTGTSRYMVAALAVDERGGNL